MSLIKLDKISKYYGQGENRTDVLHDVSLTVKQGEFIAIMGPSGSGKSTLMNIIGLLDTPTSGSYELNGRATELLSERQLVNYRKRKIGFVFQNFNLLPRETVLENIALPMVYNHIPRLLREKHAHELLLKVGLEERGYYTPVQLSGGQKQRVAIARALANKPDIVLADEPTGNLDTKTGEQILELIVNLNRDGNTIIMVTHEAHIAAAAHRIIHLVDGRITEPTEPIPAPKKKRTKKNRKKS